MSKLARRFMAVDVMRIDFHQSRKISRRATPVMLALAAGIAAAAGLGAPPAAKAQAIQQSERAQNELATTQAEAAKKIAEADGEAKSAVTRAKSEADANRIRQTSLTPQLLELRRLENQRALIDRWNGQLPTVESGQGTMLMQLPKVQ